MPDKLGGRTLVTGPSGATIFAIRDSLDTRHITLDNGCYKGEPGEGALVAPDLDTRGLLAVKNCE